MSQDTKDYYAGKNAYHDGVPFDKNRSEAWREGWEDANVEDCGEGEFDA